MTAARASKNTIVELIILALAQSKLKDLGLQAMRGVLQSDARLAVLDGAVDLESVWELLEGQPDFEPGAALAPFCYLKSLEPRLMVTIKLPAKLGELSETEIIRNAGTCKPKREEVDRVITGEKDAPRARKAEAKPFPASMSSALEDDISPRKKILGIISAVVVLASIGIVGHAILGEMVGEPKFTKIEPGLFAGEIPVRSAQKWGGEVHASLSDASWLNQPEEKRRSQLERAVQRLADQKLGVLIIEDDSKRARATAQLFGKPPRVFVRFY
jgi:hypothetical protein